MGKQYRYLTENDAEFIKEQKLFYIASCSGQEVNLSPKGYDCIRVLERGSLLYMDYPGSGNRTARDIDAGGEVTVVFNAFEGKPRILRLFCKGELIGKNDKDFPAYMKHFGESPEVIRRLIKLNIYAVESSCGMSVPVMRFEQERNELRDWAVKQHANGTLTTYMESHAVPPELNDIRE